MAGAGAVRSTGSRSFRRSLWSPTVADAVPSSPSSAPVPRRGLWTLLATSRATWVMLLRLLLAYGLVVGILTARPGLLYNGLSPPGPPSRPAAKPFETAHLLLNPQMSLPVWRVAATDPGAPVLLVIPGPGTPLDVAARRVAPLVEAGWGVVLASQTGLTSPRMVPLVAPLVQQVQAGNPGRPMVAMGYGLGALILVNGLTPPLAEQLTALILESPPLSQQDTAARALSVGPVPLIPVRQLLPTGLALRPALDALVVPTLVMVAEADPVWTPERRSALREALPRGRITVESFADVGPSRLSAAMAEDALKRWVSGLMAHR